VLAGTACAAASLSRLSGGRLLKSAGALFALGCIGALAWTLWTRGPVPTPYGLRLPEVPWSVAALLTAGALCGIALAWRRQRIAVSRRQSRSTVLAVFAILAALGIPTYAETYREYRHQEFPFVEIEMVRARLSTNELKLERIIEDGGQHFVLDREDRMQVSSRDFRRIRWLGRNEDGQFCISVRLSPDAMAEYRRRHLRLTRSWDALLIGGEVASVYEHGYGQCTTAFALCGEDEAKQRSIYGALTLVDAGR
jgi:hypothetical protein